MDKESVDLSPPEYILPECKDRPLTVLQPMREDWKVTAQIRYKTINIVVFMFNFETFGFFLLCLAAITVPADPDHEQLEPSARKQEDARRLDVPQCFDHGGQRTQHYLIYTRLLPQPVSF